MDSFSALGIVKFNELPDVNNVNKTIEDFKQLFASTDLDKSKVVSLISSKLADFKHIETGKSLDQKM